MGLRPTPATEPSRVHAIAFVAVVLLSIPMTTSFIAMVVVFENDSSLETKRVPAQGEREILSRQPAGMHPNVQEAAQECPTQTVPAA